MLGSGLWARVLVLPSAMTLQVPLLREQVRRVFNEHCATGGHIQGWMIRFLSSSKWRATVTAKRDNEGASLAQCPARCEHLTEGSY